jgi:hypothetical protein
MTFLTVFVLAAFVGYEVVSKVPSILHTPLMSGSNAIHGIILVGTMLCWARPTAGAADPGLPGRLPGHPQRGGRVRGDRPHARDVQGEAQRARHPGARRGGGPSARRERGGRRHEPLAPPRTWSTWSPSSASSWPSRA